MQLAHKVNLENKLFKNKLRNYYNKYQKTIN